jgi:hypothetical protein
VSEEGHCSGCFYYADGFQQPEGVGYCYVRCEYVEAGGCCEYHESRKRVDMKTGEFRELGE